MVAVGRMGEFVIGEGPDGAAAPRLVGFRFDTEFLLAVSGSTPPTASVKGLCDLPLR